MGFAGLHPLYGYGMIITNRSENGLGWNQFSEIRKASLLCKERPLALLVETGEAPSLSAPKIVLKNLVQRRALAVVFR